MGLLLLLFCSGRFNFYFTKAKELVDAFSYYEAMFGLPVDEDVSVRMIQG